MARSKATRPANESTPRCRAAHAPKQPTASNPNRVTKNQQQTGNSKTAGATPVLPVSAVRPSLNPRLSAPPATTTGPTTAAFTTGPTEKFTALATTTAIPAPLAPTSTADLVGINMDINKRLPKDDFYFLAVLHRLYACAVSYALLKGPGELEKFKFQLGALNITGDHRSAMQYMYGYIAAAAGLNP